MPSLECKHGQTVMALLLVLLLWMWWSADAEAAFRLHFRDGTSIDVPSYTDNGDSITYLRFGGEITIPKSSLSRIEDLNPPTPPPASTSSKGSSQGWQPDMKTASAPMPDFSIIERRDLSDRRSVRLEYRIQMGKVYSSENDLRAVCQHLIAKETKARAIHTIECLFYEPGSDSRGPYTAGRGYWSPGGRWGMTKEIRPGDYSQHALVMTYGSAAQAAPSTPVHSMPDASPAPPAPKPQRESCSYVFCPGDRLVNVHNGVEIGQVLRMKENHTFRNGTVGRAYIILRPNGIEMDLVGSWVERNARRG